MVFREYNSNSATMEPEADIREETRRKKAENDEKIRRMKEGDEDQYHDNENKDNLNREGDDYSKEFQREPLIVEKVKASEYTKEMFDQDLGYLNGWLKYELERFKWMFNELGIETKRRTERATNAKDLQEITKWHYEQVKQIHGYLDSRKTEIWGLMDLVKKTLLNKKDPNNEKEKESEQKFGVFMNSIFGKLSAFDFKNFRDQKWQKKADEYQKDILILSKSGFYAGKYHSSWKERLDVLHKLGVSVDDFLKKAEEAKKKKPGNGGNGGGNGGPNGPETPPGGGTEIKKAEQIAIHELGISQAEYKMITGNMNMIAGSEILNLVKKIFKVEEIDKKSVKSAYYRCVKEWHPDVNGGNGKKEVCEIKIKVANNLYGEYNKRFGK